MSKSLCLLTVMALMGTATCQLATSSISTSTGDSASSVTRPTDKAVDAYTSGTASAEVSNEIPGLVATAEAATNNMAQAFIENLDDDLYGSAMSLFQGYGSAYSDLSLVPDGGEIFMGATTDGTALADAYSDGATNAVAMAGYDDFYSGSDFGYIQAASGYDAIIPDSYGAFAQSIVDAAGFSGPDYGGSDSMSGVDTFTKADAGDFPFSEILTMATGFARGEGCYGLGCLP